MSEPTHILTILSLLPMLFCCSVLGGLLNMVDGQNVWCIAKPSASIHELLSNLDYACSLVDCSPIQQGNSCFYPNTYLHHASFAMNVYYQSMGGEISACDFRNSGLISLTDPSYQSCYYESYGTLEGNQTSSETWCIPKPATGDGLLQENINFACNHVDCRPIQDGGPCFKPTTLANHASFAMNLYYQAAERGNSSCDFGGSGLIVNKDPSHSSCTFQFDY